jgi:cell wall-associated NlpC family hydrolase
MDINKVKDSFKSAIVASNKQMLTQINRLYIEIIANLNCFMNQLHHSIEGHKIRQKTISVMAPFLALMLFMCYIFVTAPYGLTEDGKKIDEPYVIKAGAIELAVVENATVAEQVLAQFQKAYLTDGAEIVSFETKPFLNIAQKDLGRASGPVQVVGQAEAFNALVKSCDGINPLMTATLTEQLVQNQVVAYTSTQENSSDLTIGTKKIKTAGVNGTIADTMSITKVNGQVVATSVLQETVIAPPVNEVILVGTKVVKTYPTVSKACISTSGKAIAGTTGEAVVAYAKLFLGNPYVYGGTSLTNGTDCSGFTMSVYAHFGVYLPHASSAQRSVGTAVSYSEARPGDIICYSGHVALYIGGGKIIHASTERTGIIIGSATYKPILTIRRIL